jgi:hypothetical protein
MHPLPVNLAAVLRLLIQLPQRTEEEIPISIIHSCLGTENGGQSALGPDRI